jgi:hypothetical protein
MNRNLYSSVAFFLIFSLVFAPCLNASPSEDQVASTASSTIELNDAVTSFATVNIVALINKIGEGTEQSSDVRGALVAATILFAHMQETGTNDKITNAILAQEDDFLNNGITDEQFQSQYAFVTAHGVRIDQNQYRNATLTNPRQRQQILATIKKNGLWGIEQQYLKHLQELESNVQPNSLTPSMYAFPGVYNFDRSGLKRASLDGSSGPQVHLQRAKLSINCAEIAVTLGLVAKFYYPAAYLAAAYALESAAGWC